VVGFLFEEKVPLMIQGKRVPMDAKTKETFDAYLEIYGTSNSTERNS
jgi:hypothetical protein